MKKLSLVLFGVICSMAYAESNKSLLLDVPQSKIVTYIGLIVGVLILLYILFNRVKKLALVMKKIKQNMISKEKDFVEKVEFLLEFDKKKVSAFGARSSGKTNFWATFTHKQRYELDENRHLNVVFDKKGIQNETRLHLNNLYEILANGGIIPRTEDKDKRIIQLDLTLKDARFDKPIQQMFESFDYPGESLSFIDQYTKFINGQISEDALDYTQKTHFSTLNELIGNIKNSTGVILIVDPKPDADEAKAQNMLAGIVFSEIKRIEADKKIKVPVTVLISKADTLDIFKGKLGENFEEDRKKAAAFLKEYHEQFYDNFSDNDMNIFPVSSLGNGAELRPITDENGVKLKGTNGDDLTGYFPQLNKSYGIMSIYLEKPVEYILEKRNSLWKDRVVDIFNDPRLKYGVAKKIYAKYKHIVDFKDETFPAVTEKYKEVRGKYIAKNIALFFFSLFVIAAGYFASGIFLYAKFQKFLADSDRYKGKKVYYSEKLNFFKKNTPNLWYIKYYKLFIKFDIDSETRKLYDAIFESSDIDELTKTMYLEDFLTMYDRDKGQSFYKEKMVMLEDIYLKDVTADVESAQEKVMKYKERPYLKYDPEFIKQLDYVSAEAELIKKLRESSKTLLLFKEYLKIYPKTFDGVFAEEIKKYYDENLRKIEKNSNGYLASLKKLKGNFRAFAVPYLKDELKDLDNAIAVKETEDRFNQLRIEYLTINENTEYSTMDNFIRKCDDFKVTYPDSRYNFELNEYKGKVKDIEEESMYSKITSLDDAKKYLTKFPQTKKADLIFRRFSVPKENIEIKVFYLGLQTGDGAGDNFNDSAALRKEIQGYDTSQVMVKRMKDNNLLQSDNQELLVQELEMFNSLGYSSQQVKETKEILKKAIKLQEIKKVTEFESQMDLLLDYSRESYNFDDADYAGSYAGYKLSAYNLMTEKIKGKVAQIEIGTALSDADLETIGNFYKMKAASKEFFSSSAYVKAKENEIIGVFTAFAERYEYIKSLFETKKMNGADALIRYADDFDAIHKRAQNIVGTANIPGSIKNIILEQMDNGHYTKIVNEIKSMSDDTFSIVTDGVDKYNKALTLDSLKELKDKISNYESIFGQNEKTRNLKNQATEIENGKEIEIVLDLKTKKDLIRSGIDVISDMKVKVDNTEYSFVNSNKVVCKVKPDTKIQFFIKYLTPKTIGMFSSEKSAFSRVFVISDADYEISILRDNKEYDVIGKLQVDKTPLRIKR